MPHPPQPHPAAGLWSYTRRAAAAACLIALAGQALGQQQGQPADPPAPAPAPSGDQPLETSPHEGRPIRSIILRTPASATNQPDEDGDGYVPLTGFDAQRAENNIRTAPGTPFRASTVRDDVARLNRLNAYERVETLVQPLDDGSVNVIFTLVTRPVISTAEIVGNRAVSDQQLRPIIGQLVGAPVDRFTIDRAARRVEQTYRERGFFNAEVSIDDDQLREQGLLIFRVREGVRIELSDVRFEATDGSLAFSENLLRRQVQIREAGLFGRGAIDESILETDVASIVRYYRDRGYLDARADFELRPSPDGREAVVTFLVEQGRVYTLRDIKVDFRASGDTVFSAEQIAALVTIRPGDLYSQRELEASVQAVADAYRRLGHTDVSVSRADLRDTERPLVDMLLRVEPGPRYKTGAVIIQGNEITRQKVIRREIELRPDRPLDATAVERSENRIRRLGLFDPGSVNLTLQRPDPAMPEHRDVLVEVEEQNTASFNLGGAVSTDSGFFGRISLNQRNFDITDTPDSIGELLAGRAFRGGGQTLNIEALPGNDFQRYEISLSEPHLLDTNYSGSGRIFFRDRIFDEFDENRLGAGFSLGRSFGTRWSGAINVRLETVDITDIDPDQAVDFFEFSDNQRFIAVGPRLVRNTLDNRFLPTRGTRTELSVTQFAGDIDFTRFDAQHTVFIPLFEDFLRRSTVLSFDTNIGWIPQDDDEVPVFERFFLGGTSFRGFEFREVSPRSVDRNGNPVDDPVGGTFQFFASAQLRQPVFEDLISVVGFVDTGTVESEFGFDAYRVSVGFGMRIFVAQLSPAPLAFDFGIPIISEDDDEEQVFSFSVDIPF